MTARVLAPHGVLGSGGGASGGGARPASRAPASRRQSASDSEPTNKRSDSEPTKHVSASERSVAPMRTVLLLGGTTEAYEVAERVVAGGGWRVVTSLAGRTAAPRKPAGELRIGGFGGPDGLAAYLRSHRIDALVDATHPFAAVMPFNAAAAAAATGAPRLRSVRPAWEPTAGDRWTGVADLRPPPRRWCAPAPTGCCSPPAAPNWRPSPFPRWPTSSSSFAPWTRSADWPCAKPRSWSSPAARSASRTSWRCSTSTASSCWSPRTAAAATAQAKLEAARRRAIPVVMVARPPTRRGSMMHTVEAVLQWLDRREGPARPRSGCSGRIAARGPHHGAAAGPHERSGHR